MNTFGDVSAPAADLATLAGLLAAGRLSPEVGYRGSWEDVEAAASALLRRDVRGKAVLELT